MTTSTSARPALPHWRTPGKAVVAGVDGSSNNAAAIEYAARLAEARQSRLRLVAAVWDGHAQAFERTRTLLAQEHPTVVATEHVREGSPVGVLVDASREEAVLVVGRRGIGATERILLGSTSIGVAGRCLVPVVIVPDEWRGATDPDAPVVVALHPGSSSAAELDFAFQEAAAAGAPIVAIRIPEPPVVSPYDAWFGPGLYAPEREPEPIGPLLEPFRAEYPGVPVTVLEPAGNPVHLLLRESGYARLLVIGRHHRGPWGLGLGSVARGVLHKAELPVAVVPED